MDKVSEGGEHGEAFDTGESSYKGLSGRVLDEDSNDGLRELETESLSKTMAASVADGWGQQARVGMGRSGKELGREKKKSARENFLENK